MSSLFKTFARPLAFSLDAERAHGLSIKALKSGLVPPCPQVKDKRLQQTICGMTFDNPIGVAAGYDKNAEVPDALLRLGFGFTEVGTLTPRAQTGNPKPRVFRLVEDEGVINRLGFNNEGHAAAIAELKKRSGRNGIVGINIGANKDSEDFVADYEAGIAAFADMASYFTANISSPNTPGLRDLQAKEALSVLLERVLAARNKAVERSARQVPVFLKVAPDLTETALDDIASVVGSVALDGMIVSNTTLDRHGLKNVTTAKEAGGLSGKPLFEKSTIALAKMRSRVGPELPLIGVGGISSAEDAWQKICAGADLVQLYTGMIYQGPTIARTINQGLLDRIATSGKGSISDMRDSKTKEWAAKELQN